MKTFGILSESNNNLKVIELIITFKYNVGKKGKYILNKVVFYRDINGVEPVYVYMKNLAAKVDKDSRIKLNKINDYIKRSD